MPGTSIIKRKSTSKQEGQVNAICYSKIWKDQRRFDILVNNAGIASSALIEMHSKADIERQFAVNTVAVIEIIQYAVKLMKRNKVVNGTRGSIVNISSIARIHGNRGQIAYSGSKAAVIGVTKSAAKELAEHLICVNVVAPGLIQTPMMDETLTEKIIDNYVRNSICMHRVGEVQDVANAVLFFASDASNYITGQVLGVDGGYVM